MLIGHIEFVRDRIEHMAALRDMQDYSRALPIAARLSSPKSDCQLPIGSYETREELLARVASTHSGVFAKSAVDLSSIGNRQSDFGELSRAAIGNYTAFIHWPFQRENTPLGRAKEWDEATYGPFDDSTNEDILRGRVVRMAGADEYLRMLAIARLYFDNIPSLQSSWVTMGPKIGQLAMFFGANDMGSVMMEENVVSAAGTTYKLNEREICRLIRDAGWVPAQRDQYYNILHRHDGPDSPDLRPVEHPPMRNVRKIDKEFIGAAPGLDDGQDRSVKVQLPILGGLPDAPTRGVGG